MIVVTGAAGRLGRRVVQQLVDGGADVLGTDKIPCEDLPAPYLQADLCEVSQAHSVLADAESLIHMGAIPGPMRHDPHEIFQNNVQSTFNILMAAAAQNLRRVVFSSSAFGMGWAHDPCAFVPRYLPLDEDHPMMPFEAYGLSKQIGECIAAMISRDATMSIASLRFTNVAYPEVQAEFPWPAPSPADPLTLVMWAYADPRDVVDMHLLALQGEFEGHEAFMIAQPKTRFQEPTLELIEQNFGSQVEIRGDLQGNASVISTEKAQRMLGFKPRQNWNEP